MTQNFFYCLVIAVFIGGLCIRVVRQLPRENHDLLEPGLLFIVFILVNVLPISISHMIEIDVLKHGWFIKNNVIFSKVVLANVILMASFIW